MLQTDEFSCNVVYIYIYIYEDFSKICRKFKRDLIMRRKRVNVGTVMVMSD